MVESEQLHISNHPGFVNEASVFLKEAFIWGELLFDTVWYSRF